ncbi:MAG: hypothetical protein BGO90_08270 [Legionella sp. 40-6]|nr:hypothetical protein [Legionella sp.]OJY26556.1 MAG: hypothetical protein BGO90_08270 [Legionella sp. 40-6]
MSQSKVEQPPQTSDKKQPRLWHGIISGSLAGLSEVIVGHPLNKLKILVQQGAAVSFKPKSLYQGFLPNAMSMVPISALQVGVNHLLQNLLQDGEYELSSQQKMLAAFGSGVSASVVSCPTERIITTKMNYAQTMNMVKTEGVSALYTGMLATMLREGMFTLFWLGVAPWVNKQLQPHCNHEATSLLLSGILTGVVGAGLSQPIDTVKTRQQALTRSSSPQNNLVGVAKQMYQTEGAAGFFKGVGWRGLRVVTGMTIMSAVMDQVKKYHQTESTKAQP